MDFIFIPWRFNSIQAIMERATFLFSRTLAMRLPRHRATAPRPGLIEDDVRCYVPQMHNRRRKPGDEAIYSFNIEHSIMCCRNQRRVRPPFGSCSVLALCQSLVSTPCTGQGHKTPEVPNVSIVFFFRSGFLRGFIITLFGKLANITVILKNEVR